MKGQSSAGEQSENSYEYHGDPRATFAQFFGTSDPFASFFGSGNSNLFGDIFEDNNVFVQFGGNGFPGSFGSGPHRSQSFESTRGQKERRLQDPAIEHDLYITLEEVLHGTVKNMKISRLVIQPDGSAKNESKVLQLQVKPGWKAGTKVTFPREGDQTPGKIPADIIFTIRDKPHNSFKREGSDIKYTAKITLKESLCGMNLVIPTLTGEKIPLDMSREVIKPTTIKRIPGKGLPFPKEPSKKGDLVVAFNIEFPDKIQANTKEVLQDILPI